MDIATYSQNLKNSHDLNPLTLKLLDEIVSVFSLNCVGPWNSDSSSDKALGCIPASSFVNVSRQLGLTFTPSEQRAVEREFRQQNLEYIDLDTYVQLVDNKIKLDSDLSLNLPEFTPLSDFFDKKLDELYDLLDWQKSGKLPSSDLKHMLSCFNDGEFDNNVLNCLFKSANLNNKRILSKEEFKAMFQPVDDTAFFSLRLFDKVK